MAVSTMKKLSVITMREDRDKFLRALQKLRCVDICQTEAPPGSADLMNPAYIYASGLEGTARLDVAQKSALLAKRMADARAAADFLAAYETKKKGLFHPAPEVSLDQFEEEEVAEAEKDVEKALSLSDELIRTEAAIAAAEAEIAALEPWRHYRLPLPMASTERTRTVAGFFPASTELKSLEMSLAELAVVFEIIGQNKSGTTVALTSHLGDFEEAQRLLATYGFIKATVSATEEEGLAAGRIEAEKERLRTAEEKQEALKEEARNLALNLLRVRTYLDRLSSDAARVEAEAKLRTTDKTLLLTGWIPAKAESDVRALLDSWCAAYEITDPEEGDNAPILLSNNQFASQFEPVLAMYSLPKYGTFDPTFIMSIFYMIIFGLMFADVGYGAVLSLGAFLMLKLMKPRGTMKPFLTMFAFCGLSCIFMGILFGSYFGDLPSKLAETFLGRPTWLKPILFDPMSGQGPMYFLIISLAIGAIHLMAALTVKMVLLWKQGHIFAAICDVGSWLLIFLGIILYVVLSMALGVDGTAGIIVALIGAAVVVCTAGRSAKNPIMKFLKGLLGLYDIISYASDLLSYSRILSLCLASAVIANVVNLLGTLPGPGFGSVVGLMIAFAVGHTLNMALNVLGTFVHTSRLHYIEFFGKFYEDGGRLFTPLTPRSKYVIFK